MQPGSTASAGSVGSAAVAGELLVIKLGGAAAEHEPSLNALLRELAALAAAGARVVLVHGGGAEVSALSRRVGLQPRFRDGVRITTPEEMPYVDMVLCGAVNKRLVRMLGAAGQPAVGLSGADGPMFTGAPLAGAAAGADGNHTAQVAHVDTRLPRLLLEHGYLPVIAPTSVQPPGRAVNINADSVALRLAPALAADRLLFLSDVPGIMKDGAVLAALTPGQAGAEIAAGTISGGMIPKVEAALHALTQGVRRVVIGQFKAPGDLGGLLTGATGTTMLPHTHDRSAIQSGNQSDNSAQQPTQEVRQCNEMVR